MHEATPQSELPLFMRYPRLATRAPWISLGRWPTPVKRADNFARARGLTSLFLKREDLSHPHGAGNKVRGLEFLLADVIRRGCRTILTLSSVGSHHICKTAWHARQLDVDTVAVVVPQPAAPYVAQNLCLGASVGTRFVPANRLTVIPHLGLEWIRLSGRACYFIAPGGTTALSCMGHVNAALELREQVKTGLLPEPDYIYVALGSLGTAAGLMLGCKLAGMKTRVVGVVVSYRWYATAGRCAAIARRTLQLMRHWDDAVPDISLRGKDMNVITSSLGRGYAEPTAEAARLSEEMMRCEGIALDPTYTSKTLDGAMRFIQDRSHEDKVHVLWQTYHQIGPRPDLEKHMASLPKSLHRYVKEGMLQYISTQPTSGN